MKLFLFALAALLALTLVIGTGHYVSAPWNDFSFSDPLEKTTSPHPKPQSLLMQISGLPQPELCAKIVNLALGVNPPHWRQLQKDHPQIAHETAACLLEAAFTLLNRNQFVKAKTLLETSEIFNLDSTMQSRIHLGLAQIAFNLENYSDTRRHAMTAKMLSPSEGESMWLLAQVAYAEDDLTEALTLMEAALQNGTTDKSSAQKRFAQFHDKILDDMHIEESFYAINSLNFRIKMDPNIDASASRAVITEIEKAHQHLSSLFEATPNRPINLILYDQASYEKAAKGHEWARAFYDGKIRMALMQPLTSERFRKTLYHELTHAFVHQLSSHPLPAWFHEGLAQWIAQEKPQRISASPMPRLSDLEKDFFSLPHTQAQLAYAHSYVVMRLLVEEKGFWGVRQFITHHAAGLSSEVALTKIIGVSPEQLQIALKKTLETTLGE